MPNTAVILRAQPRIDNNWLSPLLFDTLCEYARIETIGGLRTSPYFTESWGGREYLEMFMPGTVTHSYYMPSDLRVFASDYPLTAVKVRFYGGPYVQLGEPRIALLTSLAEWYVDRLCVDFYRNGPANLVALGLISND